MFNSFLKLVMQSFCILGAIASLALSTDGGKKDDYITDLSSYAFASIGFMIVCVFISKVM